MDTKILSNLNNIDLERLQIETTTRCTLKCPACSRTIFQQMVNRPIESRDVDPDIIWNFLNCSSGKKIKTLLLCGDNGDSIYYPRLFEFIDRFRDEKNFHIVTNGSFQKESFWNKLVSKLTSQDIIEFSIDGLADTNHLYRKNSDWNSIILGLDIVSKSPVQLNWATNVFSFNYNQLDKIKLFAESYGAKFICKLSTRFGDETLRPPEEFVDTEGEFHKKFLEDEIVIEPQCKNIIRHSISSYHIYMPCGWFCAPQIFYKSSMWRNRDHWSIKNTTLDNMLTNVIKPWTDHIEQNYAEAPILCKMKCKKGQPAKLYYE